MGDLQTSDLAYSKVTGISSFVLLFALVSLISDFRCFTKLEFDQLGEKFESQAMAS